MLVYGPLLQGVKASPSILTARDSGHLGPRPPRKGPHFTKHEQKRLSLLCSVACPEGREVDAYAEWNVETNVGEGRGAGTLELGFLLGDEVTPQEGRAFIACREAGSGTVRRTLISTGQLSTWAYVSPEQ